MISEAIMEAIRQHELACDRRGMIKARGGSPKSTVKHREEVERTRAVLVDAIEEAMSDAHAAGAYAALDDME